LIVCVITATASAACAQTLAIRGNHYPRVFYFRATERAGSSRAFPTYESWERNFDGLMGIMGKCLEEECLGRLPRAPEFFTRFKQRHPDQVVLLHFNGNSRDPLFERGSYFPGHFIYRKAVTITEDVPAVAGQTVIEVSDASDFRVDAGRYRTHNDDISLFGIRDGTHDWYHCEHVQLISVDAKAKTITVKRGCYGSKPLAFQKGKSRAAAHQVEGPWGADNHFLWYYNYSTHCPKDENGKTCSDLLVDDLTRWFGNGGVLEAYDGIEFDVLFNQTHGDTTGDGDVDNGIVNGRNNYGIGVVEFARKLRARMGPEFIIQADGALGKGGERSQRCWELLNGIESEGWPHLTDWEIEDWSGGMNRHFFWQQNARQPAMNYINHKWVQGIPDRPGYHKQVDVPFSRHRLVFAAAQFFDAMICYSSVPTLPRGVGYADEKYPIWDEFVCGRDNVLGWLGRPEGPAIHLAETAPDLLRGSGRGDALAKQIDGRVVVTAAGTGVTIRPQDNGSETLEFAVKNIPTSGEDLFVSLTMKGRPMSGYPREMARIARVSASGGMINLTAGQPDETGMCLRGGEEEPIDDSTGARVQNLHRTIAGTQLPTVFVHPPYRGKVGYAYWLREIEVPANSELRFSIGMGEKSPELSDGVWFKVYAARINGGAAGPYTEIFEKSSKEHKWIPQRVTLSQYAGQRVRLKFVADCGPKNHSVTDHAHWGAVKIITEGASESEVTQAVQYMTWLNDKSFTSGFYFRHVNSDQIDLSLSIESPEPVVIESIRAHAHPDAMYRVFQHGLVLANPARKPYTFDLNSISPRRSYRRLQATSFQDTVANSGEPVFGKLTLGERDAIFLKQTAER
jgi:hypothetical protein